MPADVLLPAGPDAGEKVDPQLVAVGDAAEQGPVVLGEQRPRKVPAAQFDRLPVPARFSRSTIALRGFLGIVVDGGHAQRIVDQHGRIGQAGPFQRQRHLGDHQQRQMATSPKRMAASIMRYGREPRRPSRR